MDGSETLVCTALTHSLWAGGGDEILHYTFVRHFTRCLLKGGWVGGGKGDTAFSLIQEHFAHLIVQCSHTVHIGAIFFVFSRRVHKCTYYYNFFLGGGRKGGCGYYTYSCDSSLFFNIEQRTCRLSLPKSLPRVQGWDLNPWPSGPTT